MLLCVILAVSRRKLEDKGKRTLVRVVVQNGGRRGVKTNDKGSTPLVNVRISPQFQRYATSGPSLPASDPTCFLIIVEAQR
jgi:hypothetical protein